MKLPMRKRGECPIAQIDAGSRRTRFEPLRALTTLKRQRSAGKFVGACLQTRTGDIFIKGLQ
jgi:hypothetical protein